jgi:hypothetical protein
VLYLLAPVRLIAIPSAVPELSPDKPLEHFTDARIIMVSKLYKCPRHIPSNTGFPDQTIATEIALWIIRRRPGTILFTHGIQEELTALPDLRMIAWHSELC